MATLEREGVAAFTTRKVASDADTSTNALYELFGDKAGLVREVFFEGFRILWRRLGEHESTDDPRSDLLVTLGTIRSFVGEKPVLATVMFSRPFTDFDPGPDEARAGRGVRELVVDRVRRFLEAEALVGDETDIAHVLLAVVQGLAAQEAAGWLGSSAPSVDRRWDLALHTVLDGLNAPKG